MASSEWPFAEWEHGMGFTEGLEEEIKGMDELKLSHRLTKTKEEIDRYTIDETMDDQQKAIHLLRNGAEVQKQSVLSWITNQRTFNKDQKIKIIHVLLEVLPKTESRPPFLIVCGRTLKELMSEGTFDTKTVNTMLPIIRKMLETRDPEVLECWSETMLSAIQYLSMDLLESEILPEAIINCGLSQPVPYRLWSCKVFGALAKRLESKRIESTFFKKAMSLCQDTDYEVRSCMAKQLNFVAKGVGYELTKSVVLNEYMELLNDEEVVVRQAALSNLVHLFDCPLPTDPNYSSTMPVPSVGVSASTNSTGSPTSSKKLDLLEKANTLGAPKVPATVQRRVSLSNPPSRPSSIVGAMTAMTVSDRSDRPLIDSDIKQSTIIPMWRKLCLDKSPAMLQCMMQDFGLFLWNTKDAMREEDIEWFLSWFQRQATGKDASIKELCAFNIPALCKYLAIINPEPIIALSSKVKEMQTSSSLSSSPHFTAITVSLDALASDSNPAVRRRIASGIHELCAILGKDSHRFLKSVWCKLLMDDEIEVYMAIFKTMDNVLGAFITDPQWQRSDADFNQLLASILKKHQLSTSTTKWQWRHSHELLKQFKHFPKYFDPENIVNSVVPLLFSIILDPTAAIATSTIRDVCLETIAWYARYIPRLEQRQRVWQMIIDKLTDMQKTTYKIRICFLEIIRHVLDLFSSKFFKETFFVEYLQTGKDPIPNVRYKMVELLPAVRKSLKLPNDSQQMQKLNDIVARLVMEEEDKGVSKLLNSIVENMTNNSREGGHTREPSQNVTPAKPSSVNHNIPAVMQQPPSAAPSPQQAARLAFEARDREKEEEENKMLEAEAEYEEQRKRREIDEARQDFTKRLAERSGTAAGGERAATLGREKTGSKILVKENSFSSTLKPTKTSASSARKSGMNKEKDGGASPIVPRTTSIGDKKQVTSSGGGVLKSGVTLTKSSLNWGSEQDVTPSSQIGLKPALNLQHRSSGGSYSSNGSGGSKSSLDRLTPSTSTTLMNSNAALKTSSKQIPSSSHLMSSGTSNTLKTSPTGLSWTASGSTGTAPRNGSNNVSIGGTAGYGSMGLGKEQANSTGPMKPPK